MSVRRNKGEGSITTTTRNGKTYYKASVTIGYDANGKQIRKSFGSFKKSVVVDKINIIKYEAKTNSLSSDSAITFGNLYQSWVSGYKKNEVQNNTLDGYYTCYKLHIQPYGIAKIKVSELTLNILQRYFNELQNSCTPNNIRKIYTKIKACLEFAIIHGIVNKNYCNGVVLQKVQKKTDDAYSVFTKEEQEKIISALDPRNVVDRIIYFTFYTGLRLGEVLAVRWGRIQGNILSVEEQYQRDTEFLPDGRKKTIYIFKSILKTDYSKREIPLPDKILKFLAGIDKISSLVFCDENGDPIERKKPDRRVQKLCRELNIPIKKFHSIRHTYATRLFESDVPIKTVQALMGHADIQTTMNIYTHVMKEKKLEVIDVLEKL
ncbi:site-specific integrase [Fusobacterium necrophorum]|uniref:Site-specific integrase n=1 Tax=Fusobacterium necrophorum TaxID=859 RepID=A0A4Q2L0F3_9FUSO|nr:site-specific integrase [Fusobacterium necrophorum]RXZ69813.1 site-specific integrase [Fusobacterium necrophorum]